MKAFSIRPTNALRAYVERFWGWESEKAESLNLPTLLPGTGADVFFHYRQPFQGEICGAPQSFAPAHLICVRHKPVELRSSNSVGFLAIRFRAGALHRFTDLPGVDLVDGTMSTGDLWGSSGLQLIRDVINVASRDRAVDVIQRFLLTRLEVGKSDLLVEHAIGEIYRRCSEVSISEVALKLGVSGRELQRRVKALTGQTPVEVRQLSRLQHVVRELLLKRPSSMVETALKYGFYDQAHFTHAFSNCGLGSPQRYLTIAREKCIFTIRHGETLARTASDNGARSKDVIVACGIDS